MIKIKEVGFGNEEEAFIEKRFSDGVNVFYSDDNNKGKTILLQSLMYSIGNEPIFPNTFDSYNYYYYSKIEFDNKIYMFLRHGNSITVKYDNEVNLFSSIAEFKIFIDKNIYKLPRFYTKNGLMLCELFMFYQLFFLPQDKRDTSNIINASYLNKSDFLNMLNSMMISIDNSENEEKIKKLKDEKKNIELDVKNIKRHSSFIMENEKIAEQILVGYNQDKINEVDERLTQLNLKLSNIDKNRTRINNLKIKLQQLLSELKSINRMIEVGNVKCANCGSENIVFETKDLTFDISNNIVRSNILKSISEKIKDKELEYNDLTSEYYDVQKDIDSLLETEPIDISNFVIYRKEITAEKENNEKMHLLLSQIDLINTELMSLQKIVNESKNILNKKNEELLNLISKVYKEIDNTSSIYIDKLFTLKNATYSGSETQVFYFSKLLAFHTYFNLPFPIIIDSFREGELSSKSEQIMIEKFINIGCQVILSSTLKKQEYSQSKYEDIKGINAIDYSNITSHHILNKNFINDFAKIMNNFGIISSKKGSK